MVSDLIKLYVKHNFYYIGWYKDVIRNQEIMKATQRNLVEMVEILMASNKLPHSESVNTNCTSLDHNYNFPLYTKENLIALESQLEADEEDKKNLVSTIFISL